MEEFSKIIKDLFREKTNIIIFLLLLICILNCFQVFFNLNKYEQIRKKIDHRYFSTMQLFQEIYNIKIDTKTGEIKKMIKD